MNTTTKTKPKDAAREDATAEDGAALAAEISKLRKDLSGLVETVGRIGRERAEAIAGSETAAESLAAGEAALTGFADELRDLERDIAASTRRSPWRSIGIAVALGFLLGLFLRR